MDVNVLRDEVIRRVDAGSENLQEEMREVIGEVVTLKSREQYLPLTFREQLARELYHSICGLDVLEELLADDQITEIMVNGPDCIFVEKDGKLFKSDRKFSDTERLENVIQQIVGKINRRVNESSPIVDARLEDGSRVHIVMPPVALNGPILTIRKFKKNAMTMEKLIQLGALSKEAAEEIKKWIVAGYNIFVSGGTGSGKTTFLNAMSQYIPESQRVITIEDSAELKLLHIPNLVRLETRNANVEGNHAITIRDLLKASLRMRPDRIVIGEVRGVEALDMIQAMNTGHDGSLSTGHANSPEDMLKRLETMILTGVDMPLDSIRNQIASGVDILIHLGRLRDKSRRVLQIQEVYPMQDGEYRLGKIYEFCESGEIQGKVQGGLIKTGQLKQTDKLRRAGLDMGK